MKVFLIVWAVWYSGYMGGPAIDIIEMPNMDACQAVAAEVRSQDGWTEYGRNIVPDTIRTKCVQTGN